MSGFAVGLDAVVRAIDAFLSSKLRCFIVSFVVATAVFGVALVAYEAHGVNDDWALSNALSGTWGEPQGLTLFVNALLCQIIVFLNTAVPVFNWFAVLEWATAYLSFLAVAYFALSRTRLSIACITIGAYAVLIIPGCTWLGNFTYIAFTGCCAGTMMLMASLSEPRHKPHLIIGGLAFIFVGILWRANMFFIEIPVFGVAALLVVFSRKHMDRAGGAVRSALRLWPFALAILAFAALLGYHAAVWSDPQWHAWDDYNEVRSAFSDYKQKDYVEIAEELEGMDVSRTDYKLIRNKITADPEYFTIDRLQQIMDVSAVANDRTPLTAIKTVWRYAKRVALDASLLPFVLLMAFVAAAALRGVERKKTFAILGVAVLLGITLLFLGRIPARIHYPLWLFAFGAIAGIVPRAEAKAEASLGRHGGSERPDSIANGVNLAAVIVPVVACLLVFSWAVPKWDVARVESAVHADTFEAKSGLVDYVREHPDNVFLMHTSAVFDVAYAHYMIAPMQPDINNRMISLGGWASNSPYVAGRNERAHAANPIKALVENDKSLYVSATAKSCHVLKRYLREHYYPNATFKKVGEVESWGKSYTLSMFKFSAS